MAGWQDAPEVAPASGAAPEWASAPEVSPDGRAMLGHAIMDAAPAFGRGAMKTLSLGHRLTGAAAAILNQQDPGGAYQRTRQEGGQQDTLAQREHPIAFGVGQVAPSLAVPAAAFSSLPAALATGMGVGAASAIADTPEDNPVTLGRNALRGGLTGAALSAAGVAAPKAAGPVSEGLENVAVAQGRRVLTGGGTPMNAGKEPLSREAVQAALDTGAIGPLGTTKGAAERLQGTRETLGDQYGRIVQFLEQQGITGPERDVLAQQIVSEGLSVGQRTVNRAVPKVYADTAHDIAQGTTYPGAPALPNGPIPLSAAEDIKRSLQGQARSSYQKLEPSELGQAQEDVASIVRKANEDAIQKQVAAGVSPETQAVAAQFQPVKEQLGPIIEASRAANRGAAKASTSRAASPSDYIMGAAGLVSGGATGGGITGLLSHFARTRGASTVAWGAHAASDKIAALARVNPASLGKYGAVLGAALAKGDSEYNANYFVLGQTSAEFRQLAERLANE